MNYKNIGAVGMSEEIDYVKVYKLLDMIIEADEKTQQKMFKTIVDRMLEE